MSYFILVTSGTFRLNGKETKASGYLLMRMESDLSKYFSWYTGVFFNLVLIFH